MHLISFGNAKLNREDLKLLQTFPPKKVNATKSLENIYSLYDEMQVKIALVKQMLARFE